MVFGDALEKIFQSTLLMRGATFSSPADIGGWFISIHAPHARSDSAGHGGAHWQHISIHAPHARSDVILSLASRSSRYYFNPRSSCEERPDVDE